MKHSWLLVLMLLGIILMGAIPAGAASGAGPYYATPSWDQTMSADTRFIVLTNMPGAVLDRETGLVWEQNPNYQHGYEPVNFEFAMNWCLNLRTGNRYGWRLPTVQEFASLVDPTIPTKYIDIPNPAINSTYFTYLSNHPYWVQQPYSHETQVTYGYTVHSYNPVYNSTTQLDAYTWCVRGPQ